MLRRETALKKFIGFVLGLVIALGVVFGMRYYEGMTITNEKQWREVSNSEMSVTIPKTMKEGKGLDSSMGTEAVALYGNNRAAVSVNKLSYSSNQALKGADLEALINSMSIGGNKLKATKINDGYYATYTETVNSSNGKSKTCYSIEAFFEGESALYSIKITCFIEDRADYEPYMMKWLESFKLKK